MAVLLRDYLRSDKLGLAGRLLRRTASGLMLKR
jgi:hypothetical protein